MKTLTLLHTTTVTLCLLTTVANLGAMTLYQAAQAGNTEQVHQLLNDGADVNEQDDNGWTPLHHAAFHGHWQVVEALLRKPGIQIDPRVNEGGDTPLHFAAFNGHTAVARLLITRGAHVNLQNYSFYQDTPLHNAAYQGHTEVAQLLITRGADVNACGRCCLTPLRYAAANGHTATVQALLAAGADVNAPDSNGQTPLQIANKCGRSDIADLLQNAGAQSPTSGIKRAALGTGVALCVIATAAWAVKNPEEQDAVSEVPVSANSPQADLDDIDVAKENLVTK